MEGGGRRRIEMNGGGGRGGRGVRRGWYAMDGEEVWSLGEGGARGGK